MVNWILMRMTDSYICGVRALLHLDHVDLRNLPTSICPPLSGRGLKESRNIYSGHRPIILKAVKPWLFSQGHIQLWLSQPFGGLHGKKDIIDKCFALLCRMSHDAVGRIRLFAIASYAYNAVHRELRSILVRCRELRVLHMYNFGDAAFVFRLALRTLPKLRAFTTDDTSSVVAVAAELTEEDRRVLSGLRDFSAAAATIAHNYSPEPWVVLFSCLKRVSVVLISGVDVNLLLQKCGNRVNLHSLTLARDTPCTSEPVVFRGVTLPTLTVLRITNMRRLVWLDIAIACPRLLDLDLAFCSVVVANCGQGYDAPRLKRMILQNIMWITEDGRFERLSFLRQLTASSIDTLTIGCTPDQEFTEAHNVTLYREMEKWLNHPEILVDCKVSLMEAYVFQSGRVNRICVNLRRLRHAAFARLGNLFK